MAKVHASANVHPNARLAANVEDGVTLVITVAAARVLTPVDFGVLALAMTTGWILGVASDADRDLSQVSPHELLAVDRQARRLDAVA